MSIAEIIRTAVIVIAGLWLAVKAIKGTIKLVIFVIAAAAVLTVWFGTELWFA